MIADQIDIEWVRANYDSLGQRGCAEHLGITIDRMNKVARKYGIKMSSDARYRSEAKWRVQNKAISGSRVEPDQFINVKTPEAAYLLGFIWADGHIETGRTSVIISQTETDMQDIWPTILTTGDWSYRTRATVRDWQTAAVVSTSNRILWDHLNSHGYSGKSTLSADKILSTIPDSLKHYWFRGLFDGDGCLYINKRSDDPNQKWCIASDYDQDWSYMIALCSKLRVQYRICRTISGMEKTTGRRNRGSIFLIRRNPDIHAIMEYIYQGREVDGIGLKRKWSDWEYLRRLKRKHGNNRYAGVIFKESRWLATIPVRWGVKDMIRVGLFDTEEDAYLAQQKRMCEMGLTQNTETFWGLHNRAVT